MLQVAYQTSDDCDNWGTAVLVHSGVSLTGDGDEIPSGFETINTAIEGNLYIRFGFRVVNATSTTTLSSCLASMRFDSKRC